MEPGPITNRGGLASCCCTGRRSTGSPARPPSAGSRLIPLSLYFSHGKAKVELAVARGKRTYDKRQDLAQRDAAREVERAFRRRR